MSLKLELLKWGALIRARVLPAAADGAVRREVPRQGPRRGGGHPAALAQGGPERAAAHCGGAALQRGEGGGKVLAVR